MARAKKSKPKNSFKRNLPGAIGRRTSPPVKLIKRAKKPGASGRKPGARVKASRADARQVRRLKAELTRVRKRHERMEGELRRVKDRLKDTKQKLADELDMTDVELIPPQAKKKEGYYVEKVRYNKRGHVRKIFHLVYKNRRQRAAILKKIEGGRYDVKGIGMKTMRLRRKDELDTHFMTREGRQLLKDIRAERRRKA